MRRSGPGIESTPHSGAAFDLVLGNVRITHDPLTTHGMSTTSPPAVTWLGARRSMNRDEHRLGRAVTYDIITYVGISTGGDQRATART